MSARTLFLHGLVFSPLLGLTFIAAIGRVGNDGFIIPSCSEAQQARVAAFIKPVKNFQSKKRTLRGNPQELRSIAKEWIDDFAAKKLVDLPPTMPDDTFASGVKAQIRLARDEIVDMLVDQATREFKSSQGEEGSKDIVLAFQMCDVLKHSDMYMLSLAMVKQSYVLAVLRAHLPQIDDETKRGTIRAVRENLDAKTFEKEGTRVVAREYAALSLSNVSTRSLYGQREKVCGLALRILEGDKSTRGQIGTSLVDARASLLSSARVARHHFDTLRKSIDQFGTL